MKILIVVATLLYSSPALAVCDANTDVTRNCFEGLKEGAIDTFRTNSDAERKKTVGDAVRNCLNCATESLSDSMHQLGTSNSPYEGKIYNAPKEAE